MERWIVAACRGLKGGERYYLANRSRTSIFISPRTPRKFNLALIFKRLEEVGFPLRFTNGLDAINFLIMRKRYMGEYDGSEIFIDVKRKRRLRTLLATFVHEVAHHIDEGDKYSCQLTDERKRTGKRIHRYAGESDDEYFARGFEVFYSINPADRPWLREHHPKLYRMILRLHNKNKSRSKR